MIPLQPKHLVLAPVYIYQGLKLKKTALTLPEAEGERNGSLLLNPINDDSTRKADSNRSSRSNGFNSLNIMLLGDSSAAGVGVSSQQQALIGQLLSHLYQSQEINLKFNQIDWSLHATSGHTSFDALRRLYVLPKPSAVEDVMIVMVGVNDATANVSTKKWQSQLHEIIRLSKRKFGAKYIIFPCLPPMQNMPAIPSPLNKLLGYKITILNDKLLQVCEKYEDVWALPIEFKDAGLKTHELFAEDGFHPNSQAYAFLALKLSDKIASLIGKI
ncbi:SGNH/GDSL hydrolase family protein [Psychrobacter sp.]|uniref:SGNH/GDSL hydrolase family protein n=1 Tax=Psychrobacter sp. TaxID=56811 RepID=UPI0025E7ECD4|nr:SGNH/GDSL hydrolase family protein [Psychrobacter sp.]